MPEPDPQPVPAGAEPDPPGPSRRRALIAAGAVALVAIAAAGVALRPGPDDRFGGKIAAAVRPDRVPTGPVVTDIPFDCGVAPGTLDRLVPGADKQEIGGGDRVRCAWEAGSVADNVGGGARKLEIEVRRVLPGGPVDPVAAAAEAFSRSLGEELGRSVGTELGTVRTLPGVGAEAVTWDRVDADGAILPGEKAPREVRSRTRWAAILFRTGNVTVRVAFGGADYEGRDVLSERRPKERLLSPREALDGAYLVTRDIARGLGLGVPPDPAAAPAGAPPPTAAPPPSACALVPAATVRRLFGAAGPEPEESTLFEEIGAGWAGRCVWDVPRRSGSVELDMASLAGSPPGDGRSAAARHYLRLHATARADDPDDPDGEAVFAALGGPGDQACVRYERDGSDEVVLVFRKGRTLVRLRYWSIDDLDRDEAADAVHALAVELAGKVPA